MAVSSQTAAFPAGGSIQITPGEMLRKARETAGLGQREVSERLYLTQTYVNCIENNEWSKLPGDTFVRGYLRSYAALVGLSEAGVVAVYDAMLEEASESDRRRARSRRQSLSARLSGGVLAQRILIGLAVLLLAAGFFLSLSDEDGQRTDIGRETAQDQQASAGHAGTQADAAQAQQVQEQAMSRPQVPLSVSGAQPVEVAAEPTEKEAPVAQPGQAQPVADEPAAMAADAEAAPPAPVDAADPMLRIDLSAECWTQVKDASGRILTSRVHPEGTVLEYSGAAPYAVIIGNAAAARIEFGGDVVELGAHTSANVARLTLGN